MKPIETTLEYIVEDPRFEKERPFSVHLGSGGKYDPNDPKLNSITWEDKPVTVYDMRLLDDVSIEKYGFQYNENDFTSPVSIANITEKEVERYQIETEEFLKQTLGAEKVICYDYRFRRNGSPLQFGSEYDINDPLFPDRPPRGVHNDITFQSGPQLVKKVLAETDQPHLLNKKYRYRIVNTWRPLMEKLDDRPVAFCDYRTVNGSDLLASDHIFANLRTQLYYLKYDPKQRFYWLSHQTPREVMVFVMWDTQPNSGARFCPHVSFDNPHASANAPVRESIETRSVVISLVNQHG